MKFITVIVPLIGGVLAQSTPQQTPRVTIKNGTYEGKYVAEYHQDQFLGIPFAQPPVGDLRLRNPQSLNTSFDGVRNATEYGGSCVGYGNSDNWPHFLSEDCLTVHITRPTGYSEGAKLPVGVFIHGGAWIQDYAANGAYNLSFIVEESVKMGKPIIGVSFDYRLSAWGFLASQDILDAGIANLGLKDQRLALHFIKENIEAFGGDPERIVIWGESAGAGCALMHAAAYGGRDDGLFRGLISQSGAEGSHVKNLTKSTERYDNITRDTGCSGAVDKLDCLRKTPFDVYNGAILNLTSNSFNPIVDEDIFPEYSTDLLAEGNFTRTPLMIGTNADEYAFFSTAPVNSDAAMADRIASYGANDDTNSILMQLYPDIDALGLPAGYRNPPNSTLGAQYKRTIAVATDVTFLSYRRSRTDAWSKAGVPVYSYLFETIKTVYPDYMGTPHLIDVAYVLYNKLGVGFDAGLAPLEKAPDSVLELSQLMCRMWISFINDLDPNNHGLTNIPEWTGFNATGGYGENFYFHPTEFGMIPDTYRLAGTSFINSVDKEQFGR